MRASILRPVSISKDLIAHRDLILAFVRRDFVTRYSGSAIGVYWNVIHPLVMILIFTLIFSQVMGARLPGISDTYGYSIYLCSALLPWIAFSDVVSRSTTIFVDNANLIKKVSFPKKVLNGYVAVSAFVSFLIGFCLFLLFMVATAHYPTIEYVAYLCLVVLQLVFGFGLGLALSTLNVFFRDVSQLTGIALQVWFWLTPIVYVDALVPKWVQIVLRANPVYYFVKSYQTIIQSGQLPPLSYFIIAVSVSLCALLLGYVIIQRLKDDIVDDV